MTEPEQTQTRPVRRRPRTELEALEQRDERLRGELGSDLEKLVAGEVLLAPSARKPPRHVGVHVHSCLLDKECREYGAPGRLNVSGGGWFLTLALTPGARLAQGRLGGLVTLEPDTASRCEGVVAVEAWSVPDGRELLRSIRTCPKKRGHRGGCRDWQTGEERTRCSYETTEWVPDPEWSLAGPTPPR